MTRFLTLFFLVLGLGVLSLGWQLAGMWQTGLAMLAMIPPCAGLVWRKFRPAGGLVLFIGIMAAAVGLWHRIPLTTGVGGMICILAAWDLASFSRWLALAAPQDNPGRIERDHLGRLALVLVLGAGISLGTQLVHFSFNFEWAAVLAMISFAGTTVLFNWLKNRER
jgi:hypothetical protein